MRKVKKAVDRGYLFHHSGIKTQGYIGIKTSGYQSTISGQFI